MPRSTDVTECFERLAQIPFEIVGVAEVEAGPGGLCITFGKIIGFREALPGGAVGAVCEELDAFLDELARLFSADPLESRAHHRAEPDTAVSLHAVEHGLEQIAPGAGQAHRCRAL